MSDDAEPYTVSPIALPVSSNGHAPLKRLSALDKLFEATGEVTVRCGVRDITLPIQAVDLEMVESLCRPYRPQPKVVLGLENGVRTRTRDLTDPGYLDNLAIYNRTNSYVYVLCALLCEVTDKQGKVVWSADNSVHDVDGGMKALKDMGIVDNQLLAILTAASNLTRVVEEEQVGE